MNRIPILAVFVILFALAAADCRADEEYQELLDKDWQSMTDQELAEYDGELTEAIKDCEDYTGTQMVGQGTRTGQSYGSDIGISFGTRPGTKVCDSSELHQRQTEVRVLMQERGIAP